MVRYATAYLVTAIVFLGIDFVWLSQAIGFYKRELGDQLAAAPNLTAAGIFYAIYVVGVLVLAILPADRSGSWIVALLLGGVLGLVAYSTYDLTNLSTLRRWSVMVTVIDIGWGTFVTAISSLAGYTAMSMFTRIE